jgi:hypothetical protein
MSVKYTSIEMEEKCGTQLPALVIEKEYLLVSNLMNKIDLGSPTFRSCLEMV